MWLSIVVLFLCGGCIQASDFAQDGPPTKRMKFSGCVEKSLMFESNIARKDLDCHHVGQGTHPFDPCGLLEPMFVQDETENFDVMPLCGQYPDEADNIGDQQPYPETTQTHSEGSVWENTADSEADRAGMVSLEGALRDACGEDYGGLVRPINDRSSLVAEGVSIFENPTSEFEHSGVSSVASKTSNIAENKAETNHELLFSVLRIMQHHNEAHSFDKLVKLPEMRTLASHEKLKGIYWALKILCYKGDCTLREEANNFLRFVHNQVWHPGTTYKKKVQVYEEKAGKTLSDKLDVACKTIMHMHPETYADVCKEGIQIFSAGKRQELPDYSLEGGAVPHSAAHLHASVKALALQCARTGQKYDFSVFSPVIKKKEYTFFQACRVAMDGAFSQGLLLDCDQEEKSLFFYFRTETQPEVYVQKEVMIAMRFWGQSCTQRERLFLANDMYKAGYPLKSYDEFSKAFDATCLVCDIRVGHSPTLSKARAFWLYLQSQPRPLNVLALRDSYSGKINLGSEEMAIVLQAVALQETGIFAQWGVANELVPGRYLEQKNTLFMRILQEYASHEKECPYRVLGVFFGSNNAEQTLTLVMQEVFGFSHTHITYNKDRKTYVLRDCAPVSDVSRSVKLFVLEKMREDQKLTRAECAYELYCAGFRISDFERSQDLYNFISILDSPQACVVLRRCQGFLNYTINRLPLTNKGLKSAFANFCKNHPVMTDLDFEFSASLLRLHSAGVLESEDMQGLLRCEVILDKITQDMAGNRPQKNLINKDAVTGCNAVGSAAPLPCPSVSKTTQSFEQSLDNQTLVFPRDTQGDMTALLYSAITNKQPYFYRDIIPHAKGAQTAEEILEFVMDTVFSRDMGVEYDKIHETYCFYLKETGQKCIKDSEVIGMVGAACFGQMLTKGICTRRERAECAYALHRCGRGYVSFKRFARDFGAFCVLYNIRVCEMDDIARGQRYWQLLWKKKSTGFCEGERECFEELDCNLEKNVRKIIERSVELNVFKPYVHDL